MIGEIFPVGRGFKGLLSYLTTVKDGRQHGRAAWMEFHNLPTRNAQLAACFMAATARDSVSGTRTPLYHFSVSFDVDDPVDEATMRRVAGRTRHDMGLQEYETVVVAHQDRSHLHLHFVVNRVHPERFTLWSNWWDYARLEKSLRAQEMELGLRIVPGWHAPVPAAALARDGLAEPQPEGALIGPRPGPKRGGADFLRDVAARATPVIEQARSWAELERGLAEHGLSLRVKGGGFRITDGVRQVKASEVERGFSRHHLEKRLGGYPDYRARMAVAGIAPAQRAPAEPAQSPAQQQELAAPPSPPAVAPAPSHDSAPHARTGRRPQFGDAGHGIAELFGEPQASERVRSRATVEPDLAPRPDLAEPPVPPLAPSAGLSGDAVAAPVSESPGEPTPELSVQAPPAQPVEPRAQVPEEPSASVRPKRRQVEFLREVKERATTVLERAGSWAELERGLADRGLSLRVKGGGFTVTDGELEVKASDVGRAFSRFHLEKRLGRYPDSPAGMAAPETVSAPPTPAVQLDALAPQLETPTAPVPRPAARAAVPPAAAARVQPEVLPAAAAPEDAGASERQAPVHPSEQAAVPARAPESPVSARRVEPPVRPADLQGERMRLAVQEAAERVLAGVAAHEADRRLQRSLSELDEAKRVADALEDRLRRADGAADDLLVKLRGVYGDPEAVLQKLHPERLAKLEPEEMKAVKQRVHHQPGHYGELKPDQPWARLRRDMGRVGLLWDDLKREVGWGTTHHGARRDAPVLANHVEYAARCERARPEDEALTSARERLRKAEAESEAAHEAKLGLGKPRSFAEYMKDAAEVALSLPAEERGQFVRELAALLPPEHARLAAEVNVIAHEAVRGVRRGRSTHDRGPGLEF